MISKKARSNLLVALLSLGLAIGAAEIALRFTYRTPWYDRLIAGQRESEEYPYRYNELHLRDIDYPEKKPADTYRILMLGDSFTFGAGVYDETAVFPRLVADELNRGSPRKIEVLNGGIPGSLTQDWVELWRKAAPRFHPDLVVIVFFLRDGTRTGSIPAFFDEIRTHITATNRNAFVYRHSFLVRFIRDQIDRRRVAQEYLRSFENAYFGDELQTAEWQRAKRNLDSIGRSARESGAKVAFVIFPVLVELDDLEHYPFGRICEALERFSHEEAFPTLDLLTSFLGKNAPDLWVSAYDQHPNAKAHRVAADAIASFIRLLLK